jgi:hypothetical protein
MKTAAALLVDALFAGCSRSSHVLVGIQRPPISPGQVRTYNHPPERYEEVAIIGASSRQSFSPGDQAKTDTVIQRLKTQAAQVGANGVLIQGLGEQYAGSVGRGFSFRPPLATRPSLPASECLPAFSTRPARAWRFTSRRRRKYPVLKGSLMSLQLLCCALCRTAFTSTGARVERTRRGWLAVRHQDCGALRELAPNAYGHAGAAVAWPSTWRRKKLIPVALPPGRARLTTRPSRAETRLGDRKDNPLLDETCPELSASIGRCRILRPQLNIAERENARRAWFILSRNPKSRMLIS